MNHFVSGETIEIERETGTIFKKKIREKIMVGKNSYRKLDSKDAHVEALIKRAKKISPDVPEKHIKKGIYHTFPPPIFSEDHEGTCVISPTEFDLVALHNFFGLLGAAIAAKSRDTPDTIRNKLSQAFMETWKELRERGYLQEFGKYVPEENLGRGETPLNGALHPPWEQLKKDEQFLNVVLNTYSKYSGIPRKKIEQHLDDIIKAAEAVTEAAMKHDDLAGLIEEGKIPELDRVLYILAGKKPEEMHVKTKYPQVQKQVEEELRAKGVPEEQIKVVAPRLATAVWLDKWFENAAKSYTYKKLGGVPMDEIKNLRNMILAKKHVAEIAAKKIEEYWTRGNHVQITEKHVDPKMAPLVKEHAAGMLEDLENIRKAVKEGKMSVEEAINLMHVERDLLDIAHEHVERLMSSPEHLAKNPRPLGVEDEYVVRLAGIMKTHKELKPHLEKARPVLLKK